MSEQKIGDNDIIDMLFKLGEHLVASRKELMERLIRIEKKLNALEIEWEYCEDDE